MSAYDHLSPEQFAQAKKDYGRGWKSSQGYSGGWTSPLERADNRGEPKAWYDGYHDYAADRPKHHALTCPGEDKCPHHEAYWEQQERGQ